MLLRLEASNPIVPHALGWLKHRECLPQSITVYLWQRAGREEGQDCEVPGLLHTLQAVVLENHLNMEGIEAV